jgi:hypothetical protein
MSPIRKRWLYAASIVINILAGMATQWYKQYLPALVVEYGGNILAASCIFFGLRFLFVRQVLWKVALGAYLLCTIIELQQLYQAEWAIRIRNNYIAGIFLGHHFSWGDIVDYGKGVILGWLAAFFIEKICLGDT